jgi:hypothetical protein
MPFRAILQTLVETHAPMVRGAIFCDHEGERVDACAGPGLDPYDLDLLGATCAQPALLLRAGARARVVVGDEVVWVVVVEEGYYLVVLCGERTDHACRQVLPGVAEALLAHM